MGFLRRLLAFLKNYFLVKDAPAPENPPTSSQIPWMEIAKGELGVTEVPGPGNNKRILEYHHATELDASSDSVPWCSAFANWVMKKAGLPGTNSAAALSWRFYGKPLSEPKYGCIVVFDHGQGHGHVTFFDSYVDGLLRCLGGNQSDQVKYSNYGTLEVVGYRWPNVVIHDDSKPKPIKGWDENYTSFLKTVITPEILGSDKSDIGVALDGTEMEKCCKIIQAIAWAESDWDRTCRYVESGLGKDLVTGKQNTSEGLCQLSYQDTKLYGAPFDWNKDKELSSMNPDKTIFDPYLNLHGAVMIMTKLIKNRPGKSFKDACGAYWSSLRVGRSGYEEFKNKLKSL